MNATRQPVSPAAAAGEFKAYGRFEGRKSRSYVTPPEVKHIVNLAIHLGRPLLVEGEAGCGKTRLAEAIAEDLGLKGEALVMTTVKSTSQARDLLYRFDALRRLQDSQDPVRRALTEQLYNYIELQPLGRVIAAGRPALVLIDEVDKADIDFPNDLLDVLDRFQFEIDELPEAQSLQAQRAKGFGRQVRAPRGGVRPIVVITSNREKQLPEPFLRRCLYIKLAFPADGKVLAEIVRKNLRRFDENAGADLVGRAVQAFLEVRARCAEQGIQKAPATSELVDWVRALVWEGRDAMGLGRDSLTDSDRAVLFKVQRDLERWGGGGGAKKTA